MGGKVCYESNAEDTIDDIAAPPEAAVSLSTVLQVLRARALRMFSIVGVPDDHCSQ